MMSTVSDPVTPAQRKQFRVEFALTVIASTVGVLALAAVQHALVLGVGLDPRRFGVPLVVGTGFGVMVAVIRGARARTREALSALVRREAEITRLNVELEDRVRARTAELEQKRDELLRAQRLELVGRMAGGVAHDLNNILTALAGCSSVLRDEAVGLSPDRRPEFVSILDELDACSERARRLSQQFVTLGRGVAGAPEPLSLSDLLERTAPMLRRLLGSGIELRVAVGPASATIRADPTQIEQLVLNLAVNARDAMPGGGTLWMSAERSGDQVFLVVADDGAGMDEATRARIFEPFYTTKPVGRGTGLGLAVVAEVARRASARIDVETAVGRGTRFCVTFPAVEPRLAAATA